MESVNLERFSGFIKPKEVASQLQKPEKRRIVGYTRVSSKRQIEGYSIEEQDRSIREFAKAHGYDLIDVLGGKYESAKGDFTRKEFKRLYEMVTKVKPKPYAIAIKFISRFSRSGGGAIGLVEDLVTNKGIHLLETSSGLCSDNEDGKIRIYEKLLEAMKENKERLERTLPGMKSLLEAGNWLGKAPLGYDTYGKRVIDDNKKRTALNRAGMAMLARMFRARESPVSTTSERVRRSEARQANFRGARSEERGLLTRLSSMVLMALPRMASRVKSCAHCCERKRESRWLAL